MNSPRRKYNPFIEGHWCKSPTKPSYFIYYSPLIDQFVILRVADRNKSKTMKGILRAACGDKSAFLNQPDHEETPLFFIGKIRLSYEETVEILNE